MINKQLITKILNNKIKINNKKNKLNKKQKNKIIHKIYKIQKNKYNNKIINNKNLYQIIITFKNKNLKIPIFVYTIHVIVLKKSKKL